jgi:menaquinone-dependent protoporphyrinogen oxidase
MKVLVTTASKHGSTQQIAEAIAAELRAAGLEVDIARPQDVTALNGYGAVVLGSAIYMGKWLTEAAEFAGRFAPQLAAVPFWLFSSGPIGAEGPRPETEPVLPDTLAGAPFRAHRVFLGCLDSATLSFAERLAVKLVKAPQGDFRDWDAIHKWARDIAQSLAVPAS